MLTVNIEFLGEVHLYLGMGIQILTAVILGGLVGFDREQKMKAAGIKTNILICIGATLYTAVSMLLMNHHNGVGIVSDPSRIAAQVVSGIGFLGAGTIIRGGRGNIVGLTTAATIWVVAAIGVTIGSGYPLVATVFTVTILIVLRFLNPLYKILETEKYFQDYHVEVLSQGSVKKIVGNIMLSEHVAVQKMEETIVDNRNKEHMLNIYISTHPRKLNILSKDLNSIIQVEKVSIHNMDFSELDIDDD